MAVIANLIDEALNSTGGKQEFTKKTQQYSNSAFFIYANREELQKEYSNRWIAVYNNKVVVHMKEYHDLVDEVKHMKLPIEEVVIKFMSNRKMITLF